MIFALMMAAAAAAQSSPPAQNSAIEQAALRQLVSIQRVYVDRLTGGETAGQMRDMIISSLQNTRLFVVTENQERADATLRGSAEDLVFTESHSSSDSINARASLGNGRSNTRNGSYGGVGLGESESSHSSERRHEASAAIRLVTKDGDVIWSTIQESMGGKFRGSSADVAEKVTRKLMEDFDRAKKLGNGH